MEAKYNSEGGDDLLRNPHFFSGLKLGFIFGLILILSLLAANGISRGITAHAIENLRDNKVDNEVYSSLLEKGAADVIIEFKHDKDQSLSILDESDDINITHDYESINAVAGEITVEGLADLLKDENVQAIKSDKILSIMLSDTASLINATYAWSNQINGTNITGNGHSVCVLDTGADYTNPALQGRIIAQQCYCDLMGGCCPNAGTVENNSMDDNGHGTHVTGIIISNDTTYRGIAYGANVVSVKVCNEGGSCQESDAIKGIEYCTKNASLYNITAISISIGGGGFSSYCDSYSPTMTAAINNAVKAGLIVSIASGNNGYLYNITWPACVRNATAVTSSDKLDNVAASYAKRNALVDLIAPGGTSSNRIISTGLTGFESKSGTSMAAPHVSAAAILIKQYNLLYNNYNLTGQEIEAILKKSGKPINDTFGQGLIFYRIDIKAALDSILKINAAEKSIEKPDIAKIVYSDPFDMGAASAAFTITDNLISFDSSYPQFNRAATLSIYNLNFAKTPVVLKNGIFCSTCPIISYSGNNLSFSVTGFSNYSAASNSQLSIYDSASGNASINEPITIYANYTNRSSNQQITGSCNLTINNTSYQMSLSGIYQQNVSLSMGQYNYTIICSATDFETLNYSSTLNVINDSSAPYWSNISGSSANYSTAGYNLSIVWQDNVRISKVWIEENFTGSFANHTVSGTGSAYTYSFGNISVGNYTYRWYANDTSGNINDTGILNFTLNKGISPVNLYLNGNQANISITYSQSNATATAGGTAHLFRDGVPVTNPEIITLKPGNYTYKANATGNANYTDNAGGVTYTLSVSKTAATIILKLDGLDEDIIVSPKENVSVLANLIAPAGEYITVKRNANILASGNSPITSSFIANIGTYNINASFEGNENYTSTSSKYTVTVKETLEEDKAAAGLATQSTTNTTSANCTEEWKCTAWSNCTNNKQFRNCTDIKHCNTTRTKPSEEAICDPNCAENWKCTAWSKCSNNTMLRVCSDLNNCSTTKNKPAEKQNCDKLSPIQQAISIPAAITGGISSFFVGTFNFTKNNKGIILGIIFAATFAAVLIRFSPDIVNLIRNYISIIVKENDKNEVTRNALRLMQRKY